MTRLKLPSHSPQGSGVKPHHWSPPTSRFKTKVVLLFFFFLSSLVFSATIILEFTSFVQIVNKITLNSFLKIIFTFSIDNNGATVLVFRECQSQVYSLYSLQHALHSWYGKAVSGAIGCCHQAPRHAATWWGEWFLCSGALSYLFCVVNSVSYD